MSDKIEPIQDPVKQYEGSDALPADAVLPPLPHAVGGLVVPQRSTWTTGLFDCVAHGWSPCMDVFCCGICVISQMYNKMYHNRTNQIHWPLCGCLFVANILNSVEGLGGFSVITNAFVFTMRRDLRNRYNIHIDHDGAESALNEEEMQREVLPVCGEFGSDMLLSLFCGSCLLCQMQREMALRGDYAGYVMLSSEVQQTLSQASQPTVQHLV